MGSFNQHARQVVNPRLSISRRYLALGTCIQMLAERMFRDHPYRSCTNSGIPCFHKNIKRLVWKTHYQFTRARFNRKFGFDYSPLPQPEQLTDAIAAVQVERNKLIEVERVLGRRRAHEKARGMRPPNLASQKAAYELWNSAVLSPEED